MSRPSTLLCSDHRLRRWLTSGLLGGLLGGLLLLTACSSPEQQAQLRMEQLKQALPNGLPLPAAKQALQTNGVIFSEKTAVECENLGRQSRVQTQLPARGGPCLFGKWAAPKAWYGRHVDVILQLVFDTEGKLVDGNYETIDGMF